MAGLFDEEILGAKEQALTARKLREAGIRSPEGQMVSGHFVAPSITQYLAEALKGYGLKRGEDMANEKYDTLRADRNTKISELLKNFPQTSTSYPNAEIGNDGPTIEAQGQPVTKEPTEQDYINWGVNASAVSPEIGALGTKLAEYSMSRKDKQTEAEARRQDKKDLLQWQATQAKQAREEQAAYRADNARLIASLRPAPQEPLVAIMGPNGPVMVPRSQAIGATPANTKGGGLSVGDQAVDKNFAKEYVEFNAAGGYADVQKSLDQLRAVSQALNEKGGKNLTGPILGSLPDSVLKFTNPDAINTRETVEEVVQRNLRLVLGAQFTEKEGERLIARAYNPNLSEAENSKRLDRLIKQIEGAALAKQQASDYFEKNGTLKGWGGKIYTREDFTGKESTAPATGGKFLGFE